MPDLLHFEWKRPKGGFELLKFDPNAIEERFEDELEDYIDFAISAAPEQTKELVRRAGGRLWLTEGDEEPSLAVVPVGNQYETYYPLKEYPTLFMEFATVNQDPESVIQFLNRYGLLEGFRKFTEVNFFLRCSMELKKAVDSWDNSRESRDYSQFIELFNRKSRTVELMLTNGIAAPILKITPPDLLDAIWIQFAQFVTGSNYLRRCAFCGTWFIFGTGTGRRKSAHYCSDRCRKAAFNARKEASS